MSKIICDLCNTEYSDSEDKCPLCGWPKGEIIPVEVSEDEIAFDSFEEKEPEKGPENIPEKVPEKMSAEDAPKEKQPEVSVPVNPLPRPDRTLFDYDAENGLTPEKDIPAEKKQPKTKQPESAEEPQEAGDLDDEPADEEPRSSTLLIIILLLLIIALLGTSVFIFWRYYLPNYRDPSGAVQPSQSESTAAVETEKPTETTQLSIPCTGLSIVSGMEKLTFEGQNWLLHIKATPEDTTDEIIFLSEDESVVTVNSEGRVTVVGEGETTITVSCGAQRIAVPVSVSYEPSEPETTEPPATEPSVPETEPATQPTQPETQPTQPTPVTEPSTPATEPTKKPDVVLKLKKTDITLIIRGLYVTLQLDCDLRPEDVEWSTGSAAVATVDKYGNVTGVGNGLTVITVKYGNQTVECKVRCQFN